MMRGSVLFPATNNVTAPERPELDLGGWPSWIRDALSIGPETTVPTQPSIATEPTRVHAASARKLTRVPPRS